VDSPDRRRIGSASTIDAGGADGRCRTEPQLAAGAATWQGGARMTDPEPNHFSQGLGGAL
jgi:hypothetical protein